MPVFNSRAFNQHEQVVFCSDEATGLRAMIGIHSTALGPAAGGCRFWDYEAAHRNAPGDVAEHRALEDAIFDVLRLSRGMSYKNALAGLRLGGGKSVIIGNPKKLKTPELLRAFGRHLQRLNGAYFTAEDVGTSPADLAYVSETTDFCIGLDDGEFAAGDPSPHTAVGIFLGIKAALKYKTGNEDLAGRTVAIQGVGNVGRGVAEKVRNAGGTVIIADLSAENIDKVRASGPCEVVAPDAIHAVEADVFAPCALGGGLNPRTIPEIKAGIVAGAANNMLDDEKRDDKALRDHGILYAPDYVINAGGIMSIESEVHKEPLSEEKRQAKIARIPKTLTDIFVRADQEKRSTGIIANEMAQEIIDQAKLAKSVAAE